MSVRGNRAGVFNRFWSTMGGGEQLAAAYALALAPNYKVDLIATEELDLELISRRLGKPDLADLSVRIIGDSPTAATEISAEYDVFVNHSFTSEDANLSDCGIYVCMFPQQFRSPTEDDLRGRFECKVTAGFSCSHFGDTLTGSSGSSLTFWAKTQEVLTFVAQGASGVFEIRDTNNVVISRHVFGARRLEFFKIPLPEGQSNFSIADAQGAVRILTPRLADGMRLFLKGDRIPDSDAPAFVSTYDHLLSISHFTKFHTSERWKSKSSVHYPPVGLRQKSAAKENVILSVGRFFAEDVGHCKQQLRMVQAFRRLVDNGLSGWRLSLVGGCDREYRDYALAVRREAYGYPIDVFLNADMKKLDQEFARAKIYWHATGLGTDIESHPDRAEHFGIAPIEAMSAGAIPIVFEFGGPREIVEEGVSGFFFRTEDQLVSQTLELIALPEDEQLRLSLAAVHRSARFSSDVFRRELLDHIDRPLGKD